MNEKDLSGDIAKPAADFAESRACPGHAFVSIIVCTSGQRASLFRCLDSLRKQGCGKSEILLALSGPAEQGYERTLAQLPSRLVRELERGVCRARNRAIPLAKGEILAFVDDDVVVHPNWLHELIKGFQDPTVACTTGRVVPDGPTYFQTERASKYFASDQALTTWVLSPSDPDWYEKILTGRVGFGCSMAFRKTFLEKYAIFPTDLGAGTVIGAADEYYMFIQVVRHGFRIYHASGAVVSHLFEEDRTVRSSRMKQLYSGGVAFALKMLVEERGLRKSTFRWLWSALRQRLRRAWRRKSVASEPQELLSVHEKLFCYVRGPIVYWKSRRLTRSPNAGELR